MKWIALIILAIAVSSSISKYIDYKRTCNYNSQDETERLRQVVKTLQ